MRMWAFVHMRSSSKVNMREVGNMANSNPDPTARGLARPLAHVTAVLFAMVCCAGANAAEGIDIGERSSNLIEEIIVTAEKREMNVQEIPIAISVFSAEALDNQGITNLEALQFSVPGLNVGGDRAINIVTLRGVSQENTSSGGESGIAFHLDGVYQARAFAGMTPLFDMERVEVLRGPQGTLYGRNATGGAINYITKKPQHEFEATADVLLGDYDRVLTRGAVNLPLKADQIALRISFLYEDRDGYYDNIWLNKTEGDIESRGYRAQLSISPTSDIEILLSSSRETAGGNIVLGTALTDMGLGTLPVDSDPFTIRQDFSGSDDDTFSQHYGKLTWDLDSMVFSSLTAYAKTDVLTRYDFDYTEGPFIAYDGYRIKAEQWTQEFQLFSNTAGSLEWILGLYYLKEKNDDSGTLNGPFFQGYSFTTTIDTDSYAAYGQATYAMTDKLSLTAGLRYTDDQKDTLDTTFLPPGFTGLPDFLPIPLARDMDWEEVTGKIGVEYNLSDNGFIYASVSRGYKGGGVWVGQAEPYYPEYIIAYEIGSKNTLLGGAAQLNTAVYYYDYEDMQVRRTAGTAGGSVAGRMDNASAATITGVEVDFRLLPIANLDISGSIAFTNAEFDKFSTIDTRFPELGEQDLSGNTVPRVAEWSFKLAAQYTIHLGRAGILTPRINYYWRDDVQSNFFNDREGRVDSMPRTDIGLRYDAQDGRWYLDAFMHYLEDDDALLYRSTHFALPGAYGIVSAPRTYGVRLGVAL